MLSTAVVAATVIALLSAAVVGAVWSLWRRTVSAIIPGLILIMLMTGAAIVVWRRIGAHPPQYAVVPVLALLIPLPLLYALAAFALRSRSGSEPGSTAMVSMIVAAAVPFLAFFVLLATNRSPCRSVGCDVNEPVVVYLTIAMICVELGTVVAAVVLRRAVVVIPAATFLVTSVAVVVWQQAVGAGWLPPFWTAQIVMYVLLIHMAVLAFIAVIPLLAMHKIGAAVCGGFGLVVISLLIYTAWIEPYWLEVTTTEVAVEGLTEELRIVVVADLQFVEFGDYEQGVLRDVADLDPDVVVFVGDYVTRELDDASYLLEASKMNAALRELDGVASAGVFAVTGDQEQYEGSTDRWHAVFDESGVEFSDEHRL